MSSYLIRAPVMAGQTPLDILNVTVKQEYLQNGSYSFHNVELGLYIQAGCYESIYKKVYGWTGNLDLGGVYYLWPFCYVIFLF